MKMNKLILGASALVLTVAGALAGRASVKANAAALYYTGFGKSCTQIESSITSTSLLTTGGTTGSQATLKTSGGSSTNLYSTSTCTAARKIRFHG